MTPNGVTKYLNYTNIPSKLCSSTQKKITPCAKFYMQSRKKKKNKIATFISQLPHITLCYSSTEE